MRLLLAQERISELTKVYHPGPWLGSQHLRHQNPGIQNQTLLVENQLLDIH
jgi:hypothetical protein